MAATLIQFPVRKANPEPDFLFEGGINVEREEGENAFGLVFEGIGTITLTASRLLDLIAMGNARYREFRNEDGARMLLRAIFGDDANVINFPKATYGEAI
jgi:hypothetical protein